MGALHEAISTIVSQHPKVWIDIAFVMCMLALPVQLSRFFPLYAIFVLPGTFAHEMAHWLVALVLGGRPRFPSLTPAFNGSRWRLGEVSVTRPSRLTLPFIALAPLCLLPVAAYGATWVTGIPLADCRHWIGLYVLSMIVYSATPSTTDWLIFWRSAFPALLISACLVGVWLVFRPQR